MVTIDPQALKALINGEVYDRGVWQVEKDEYEGYILKYKRDAAIHIALLLQYRGSLYVGFVLNAGEAILNAVLEEMNIPLRLEHQQPTLKFTTPWGWVTCSSNEGWVSFELLLNPQYANSYLNSKTVNQYLRWSDA